MLGHLIFGFFHCLNQYNIRNNNVTKYPTKPQVYRYTTLWNIIRVLKATFNNRKQRVIAWT